METKTAAQAEMLANRLKKRYRHLQKWARRTDTGAFRLYDRDIPEIPLVLDIYGDAVSGALYRRPYEKDEAEEEQWLQAMTDAAAQALEIQRDNIIIKHRQRQRGQSQYEKMAHRGLIREVREGNLLFKVNLSDYLDTGLFPDRRAMRRMINADSSGKRVLNLFCYTAAFSIHAASGGAASTNSVDLSNTYLNWARDNFSLNGFDTAMLRLDEFTGADDQGKAAHKLIRADALAFLRTVVAAVPTARRRWDSIIIDPPAFSNSTMARADFDLNRDYKDLLADCLALLAPGGKVWFSANARSFKADAAELEIALANRFPGIKVSDYTSQLVDEDFKGKKIPKAFILEITL
jgi:23S rRNA G2069 N7-methylase RlmK/C1962 C5-methylase RlmI